MNVLSIYIKNWFIEIKQNISPLINSLKDDELAKRFNKLEASVNSRIKKLFGGN